MSKTKDCQFCGQCKLSVVHLVGGGYGVRIVDWRGVAATYGHEDCTPFDTREEAIKEIDAWCCSIINYWYIYGAEFTNKISSL